MSQEGPIGASNSFQMKTSLTREHQDDARTCQTKGSNQMAAAARLSSQQLHTTQHKCAHALFTTEHFQNA